LQLAAEMEKKEMEKAELERLRIELYQEEEEEKARKRDQVSYSSIMHFRLFFKLNLSLAIKELLRTRIRKRLELIDAYQRQVEDKKRRLQQEREDEEVFRKKVTLTPLVCLCT
jgi:hypothetical protein